MKRILLSFIYFVFGSTFLLKGQSMEYAPVIDYLQQQGNYQVSGGFILRAPINDDVSLNYRVTLGYKTGGGIYVHGDAGAFFGVFLISTIHSNIKAIGWVSVLSILLPEGIGYYPDKNHNLYVAINPLDIDYWHRKKPSEENSRLCGTVETSYKLPTSKGISGRFMPFVAFNVMYNPADEFKRFGVRVGVALLFSNDTKEKTQYNYE